MAIMNVLETNRARDIAIRILRGEKPFKGDCLSKPGITNYEYVLVAQLVEHLHKVLENVGVSI